MLYRFVRKLDIRFAQILRISPKLSQLAVFEHDRELCVENKPQEVHYRGVDKLQ